VSLQKLQELNAESLGIRGIVRHVDSTVEEAFSTQLKHLPIRIFTSDFSRTPDCVLDRQRAFLRPSSLASWLSHLMVSRSETARPLLTLGEIMQRPPSDEIIMVAGTPPIRAKKVRYYEDRRVKDRIMQPPALTRPTRPGVDDWSRLPLPNNSPGITKPKRLRGIRFQSEAAARQNASQRNRGTNLIWVKLVAEIGLRAHSASAPRVRRNLARPSTKARTFLGT
jgi:hypothetical protein